MRILAILLGFFATAGYASISAEEGSDHSRIIDKVHLVGSDPEEFFERVRLAVNFSSLVFAGQRAQPGQFPMQAFLSYASRKGGFYICGASLLSTTHAVTAGHCTVDMTKPAEIMVGGTNMRQRGGNAQWRRINKITTFPEYNKHDPRIRKDIGIVEFSPPVQLNHYVQTTKIVSDDSQLLRSKKAVISGFGTHKYAFLVPQTSENLLFAEVNLYNFNYCRSRWFQMDPAQTQICAGAKNHGTGQGDSGGPIQVRHNGKLYQVGLTSYGAANPNDAQYNQDRFPSVFTRVSKYCNFISKTTNGKARCGQL
ncbi:hypothetical protein QR680_012123 [Steinernema hermaphroditum]|uniref:Peptidase S1 domain-containing protein n=1 Tax=Steinernema hermaphroditum TaxID=289476 RepID=A0AA39I3P0_9BILA|nr:hypothetical protein QR680_012123 [Steinernema hermaphroditum]